MVYTGAQEWNVPLNTVEAVEVSNSGTSLGSPRVATSFWTFGE